MGVKHRGHTEPAGAPRRRFAGCSAEGRRRRREGLGGHAPGRALGVRRTDSGRKKGRRRRKQAAERGPGRGCGMRGGCGTGRAKAATKGAAGRPVPRRSAPAADAPVRAQAARPRRATPRTDGPHGTARASGRFGEAESPGAKPFPIAGGTARGPGGRDGIARRRERRPPARGRATGARETARSAGSARGPAIGNRVLGAEQGGAEPGRGERTGRGDAPARRGAYIPQERTPRRR